MCNKSQCEQGESILDRKTKEIVSFLKNWNVWSTYVNCPKWTENDKTRGKRKRNGQVTGQFMHLKNISFKKINNSHFLEQTT